MISSICCRIIANIVALIAWWVAFIPYLREKPEVSAAKQSRCHLETDYRCLGIFQEVIFDANLHVVVLIQSPVLFCKQNQIPYAHPTTASNTISQCSSKQQYPVCAIEAERTCKYNGQETHGYCLTQLSRQVSRPGSSSTSPGGPYADAL